MSMTEQEILRSKLLSPEQQTAFTEQVVEITETIVTMQFSGVQETLMEQLHQITYLQGKRTLLLELLADSNEAFNHLSNLATNSRN